VLVDEDTRRDGAALARLLSEARVERLFLPFVALQQLAGAVAAGAPLPVHLRDLVTAGEQLQITPAIADLIRCTGCRLHNHYGPSESHVVTAHTLVGDPGTWPPLPPIGRPIAGAQVRILDGRLRPLPVGAPGELCIGGLSLARGYWGRADLTAERFVCDPLGASGDRLYRSGDLARWRPDGTLEYLGRLDGQVKIRGYRIEPGEIEAALACHPQVQEVVVLVREVAGDHRQLVACLVAEPRPSTEALRAFLKERLPGYMIPAGFAFLDALPRTPSGKIDRRALAAVEPERVPLPESEVPLTALEATLAAIWCEVLGLTRVGVRDNFFSLGGDSILIIQVIDRASRAGLRLTPRDLFAHQTIAELAAVVVRLGDRPQEPAFGPLTLAPVQHWFFALQNAELHHWNMAVLLAVPATLDPMHLEQATATVLAHHDALRSRFVCGPDGWQAEILPEETAIPFEAIDLAPLADGELVAAIAGITARVHTSLDLARGPLLRVVHLHCGAARPARLLLVAHHLVVDGVSLRILIDALRTASAGEPLPARTTPYREWTARLAAFARSGSLADQGYWRTVDPAATHLPRDFAGSDFGSAASARTLYRLLDAEHTRALLQEAAGAYHTEVGDLLVTALARALARWSAQRTFTLALEGHGREMLFDDVDLSRTVGWFTSVFPVRLALPEGDEPGSAIRAIKEQLRQVPARGIGYGLLRHLADPADPLAAAVRAQALPEVSFNYLGQLDASLGPWLLAPESPGPLLGSSTRRFALLYVSGAVVGAQLRLHIEYSDTAHREETIARFADALLAELQALIAHCLHPDAGGFTPSDFPEAGLSQTELDALLADLEEDCDG
jgi:non-ribosomal peptide synthase protein (TIGR01720 family)